MNIFQPKTARLDGQPVHQLAFTKGKQGIELAIWFGEGSQITVDLTEAQLRQLACITDEPGADAESDLMADRANRKPRLPRP